MQYYTKILNNGLKLIHFPVNSEVAHCGLIINAGSRDEEENEQGIAHFIEHLMFKGTKKRKAFHILSRMDDVGGEINAYTSKEETCIHSSFIRKEYERAIELISDITFNSTFPGAEINKERSIILDEIKSYLDTPSESIYDDFEELIFKNQPLGKNILGKPDSLKKFTRKDIESFIRRNYNPNEMVLGSVGKIDFEKLIRLTEKYFGDFPSHPGKKQRISFTRYSPSKINVQKGTNQAHCMMGNIAYSMHHPKTYSMALLDNLIGGPGLNTRLNMQLRERLGYVYHVESNYTAFSDIGLFSIYFGSEKEKADKTIEHILREFKKLREKKLGTIQLSRAKKQLYGQIAINAENNSSLMLSISKSYLMKNKVDSLEEIHNKIQKISAEDILETANEILVPEQLSTLIYH